MTTTAADQRRADIALLESLEIEDCDCPLDLECPCDESCRPLGSGEHGPPCPHCAGICDCSPALFQPPCVHVTRRDHDLSLDEWTALLHSAYPADYAEPPQSRTPTAVLTREARVDILAVRADRGESLWHDDDLDVEDAQYIATQVRLSAGNFRPKSDGVVIEKRAA